MPRPALKLVAPLWHTLGLLLMLLGMGDGLTLPIVVMGKSSGQWAVNQLGALILGGNLESNLWDGGGYLGALLIS
jgi:hypothetical protein